MLRGFYLLVAIMVTVISQLGVANADELNGKIICIGDSVTKGIWLSENINKNNNWVNKFAANDSKLQIINAGRENLKTGDLWYLKEVVKTNPDANTYIIYVGTNDLRGIDRIRPEIAAQAGARALQMVNIIRETNDTATIYLVAPPRINPENLSAKWQKESFGEHTAIMSDLLAGSIEAAAKESGVEYINLIDTVAPEMLVDGVRPGVEGHEEIAKAIWGKITNTKVTNTSSMYTKAKKIAPPAAGKPYINDAAVDALATSLLAEIKELEVAGTPVTPRLPTKSFKDIKVDNFISAKDFDTIAIENACILGEEVAKTLTTAVEKELALKIESVMEEQFAGIMSNNSEAITVEFALPQQDRADAYIMAIQTPDHEQYSVLAGAVDWNKVDRPLEKNEVKINSNENQEAELMETVINEEIDLAEARSLVKNLKEKIIEKPISVTLPEVDMIETEIIVAEEPVIAIAKNEETKIPDEPGVEYLTAPTPGYAVFVHTHIEK